MSVTEPAAVGLAVVLAGLEELVLMATATVDKLVARPPRYSERGIPPDGERGLQELLMREPKLAGVGYAFGANHPGSLAGSVAWASRSAAGPVTRRLTPPTEVGLGVYQVFGWAVRAREADETVVDGPYVDYLCNDEYTITVARRVPGTEARIIAAADLLVSGIEAELLPAMVTLERPAAILNQEGRVVVSTSPEHPVGILIRRPSAALSSRRVPFRATYV